MKKKPIVIALIAVFLVGWVGAKLTSHSPDRSSHSAHNQGGNSEDKIKYWSCSMHPQIKLPGPGKCPICAMDLIPVKESGSSDDMASTRRLVMSPDAARLARIRTAEVQQRAVKTDVRMVGKIEYDETRLSYITAWVDGRIDRLYVDYTGVAVNKGDHMVYIYSPTLLSAQEEYLQSLKNTVSVKDSHLDIIRSSSAQTVENSREKLKLLGIKDNQIAELEKSGKPTEHMTIYAPVGGIVIKKEVQEGAYVKTGARIYSIADLSKVWAILDAYESDLAWLRYGQMVAFETESYPGEVFKGRISFISPVLEEDTRTIKIRVNVDNSEGRLKPGMFVRAVVRSKVTSRGKVIDESMAGKWIGPMHPEIVKDGPGACDICGMDLVPAEKLGYIGDAGQAEELPLVIPASAPLITGKRAVVYVEVPDKDKPTYEGREIVLGARAGDYYTVRSGLKAGERVVVNGNFKIDSALQIQAKPSMMNPEGGGSGGGMHDHGDGESMSEGSHGMSAGNEEGSHGRSGGDEEGSHGGQGHE